ncbi:DUF4238 domain-containing protein [Devosia sp. BK]|uniref:DUF4238 domain-containing protein n=1 Tax=Devosia sp. BK TaxID=2871706 RepID=UPI002939C65A|nr:DUF4238 domain-containing protein [Devosia sp. BK]MDV3251122.1 DUF4238 domain-containing protein [Devosia sp. BK]
MNAPHRHHYIPRMILRNFLNDRRGLYFWRRGFPVGDIKSTKPENLFVEDDLYTIVGDEGERDVSVEHGFAKMETSGAHLIRQLVDIVRAGKKPRLEEATWEFLQHFRYFADKRSSAWHSRFLSDDEFNAVMAEVASQPHWTDEDRAWMSDPKDVDRIKRNSRIAAQTSGPPDELLDEMRKRGLAIYVAPRNGAFILGDHPTAMARVGQAAKDAPGGKISFMPIASDMAIGYYTKARTVHVEQLTRAQLRTMNEAMVRQSVMIAGRSRELVSSLSKIPYETPDYFTTSDYLWG